LGLFQHLPAKMLPFKNHPKKQLTRRKPALWNSSSWSNMKYHNKNQNTLIHPCRWPDIQFEKNCKSQNLVCLTHLLMHALTHACTHTCSHSLTTVASLEAKRSRVQPWFYATILNSLVGCAFWGSDECAPFMSCIFFYLPLSPSSSSCGNHIKALIFHIP